MALNKIKKEKGWCEGGNVMLPPLHFLEKPPKFVRCPICNKRLRPKTIWDDHGFPNNKNHYDEIEGFCVPKHKEK